MTITFDDFLLLEAQTVDTIDVKRVYIDLAGGDLVAGVMLSQIIYWHLPKPSGATKLVVTKDKKRWLVKAHIDWWNECRISCRQAPRALALLQDGDRPLVETAIFKFNGAPTTHIRLIAENFLARLGEQMRVNAEAAEHPDLSSAAQVSKRGTILFGDSSQAAQERQKARREGGPTPQQLVFGELQRACHIKRLSDSARGRLNVYSKWLLDNGHNAEDVTRFATWWESDEWHRVNAPLTLDKLENNLGGWIDLGKPDTRAKGNTRTQNGAPHANAPTDYTSDPSLVGRA